MKIKLLAACLLIAFATPAAAQSTPAEPTPAVTSGAGTPEPQASQPAPSAPPQPNEFIVKLDGNDLAAIGNALNELPKKIADPLIMKINAQLQAQTKKQ